MQNYFKMGNKARKEKNMKNTATRIIAIMALLLLTISLCSCKAKWNTVTSSSTLEWCEESSPSKYEDIKASFSRLITKKTGNVPEKVCFSIDIGNYVWGTYQISLYYRYDGTWYTKNFSHDQIGLANAALDQAILEEFCGW